PDAASDDHMGVGAPRARIPEVVLIPVAEPAEREAVGDGASDLAVDPVAEAAGVHTVRGAARVQPVLREEAGDVGAAIELRRGGGTDVSDGGGEVDTGVLLEGVLVLGHSGFPPGTRRSRPQAASWVGWP